MNFQTQPGGLWMKMHPVRYEFPLVLTLLADISGNPHFHILYTVPSMDPRYSKSNNRIQRNSILPLLPRRFPDSPSLRFPETIWFR